MRIVFQLYDVLRFDSAVQLLMFDQYIIPKVKQPNFLKL